MATLPSPTATPGSAKTDDESRNLETQARILAEHGIRDQLVFTDVASGQSLQRPGWGRGWCRCCSLETRWWWLSWTGSAGTSRRV